MSTLCSSSSGSRRGISSGSFCRSASIVAMTSPRAASNPASNAADCPPLLRHADHAQPRVVASSPRRAVCGVSSVLPSSMMITSNGLPSLRERRLDALQQRRDVLLLVVAGDHQRQVRGFAHAANKISAARARVANAAARRYRLRPCHPKTRRRGSNSRPVGCRRAEMDPADPFRSRRPFPPRAARRLDARRRRRRPRARRDRPRLRRRNIWQDARRPRRTRHRHRRLPRHLIDAANAHRGAASSIRERHGVAGGHRRRTIRPGDVVHLAR